MFLFQNIFIQGKTHLTFMDIAITHMSSKGQIVIPSEMRKDISEKEPMVILKSGDSFVLKKAKKMHFKVAEDLEFAKRVEEAWKQYDRGEFKTMDANAFLDELKSWKSSSKKNSKKNSTK